VSRDVKEPRHRPISELVRDVSRGALTERDALRSVDVRAVSASSLSFDVDAAAPGALRGVPAGPGAASGHATFDASTALELSGANVPVILIVFETFPEDIEAMRASAGVITVHGGLTGHAAVVSRGLGKPCIASGSALDLRGEVAHVRSPGGGEWRRGERLSFDGRTGAIVHGVAPLSPLSEHVAEVLSWADAASGASIVARVSTADDARNARVVGAKAIAVDGPDALLLGSGRAALVSAALGEGPARSELLAALVRDLRDVAEAFGAPIRAGSPLRLAAHEALRPVWIEACGAVGIAVDERLAPAVAPVDVPAARMTAALAALGSSAG
jgi:pyruvate,orthophosphate dikinase